MFKKLKLKDKIIISLASLFGVGFVPFAPGTASCFLAVLLFWFIRSQAIFILVTLFFLGLAFFISGKAEKVLAQKDSKKIVIDDFAGMLVTFLFVPPSPLLIVVGFFIFRLLDILKIPPANILENKKGSAGVVGDDLAAGIYANLTVHLLRLLLKISV